MKKLIEILQELEVQSLQPTKQQILMLQKLKKDGWKIDNIEKDENKNIIVTIKKHKEKYYMYPDGSDITGIPMDKVIEGWWMDAAGGVHSPDEDDEFYDPSSMYA